MQGPGARRCASEGGCGFKASTVRAGLDPAIHGLARSARPGMNLRRKSCRPCQNLVVIETARRGWPGQARSSPAMTPKRQEAARERPAFSARVVPAWPRRLSKQAPAETSDRGRAAQHFAPMLNPLLEGTLAPVSQLLEIDLFEDLEGETFRPMSVPGGLKRLVRLDALPQRERAAGPDRGQIGRRAYPLLVGRRRTGPHILRPRLCALYRGPRRRPCVRFGPSLLPLRFFGA
jgi:hypothetical protein